jgi:YidC/Oxa1 family membrane protein insertase
MFQTYIVQPIFNILVAIYALIPGHDLGVAVILFTVLVRLALWPLLKKQLHQTKVMQVMQPKLKKIKAQTKGDKQKEAQMMMELYREHGVSPFGSIGVMIIQLPILFGLYEGIRMISEHPDKLATFTYPFVRSLPFMHDIIHNIHNFHQQFFNINIAIKPIHNGQIYWPLMVIALAASILQYFQSKQLLPQDKEKKSLRQMFRDQAAGKGGDAADMTASIGRSTLYFLPGITFIFAISVQGALDLYLLAGALVGIWQQGYILKKDVVEMEEEADMPAEAEPLKPAKGSTQSRKNVASKRVRPKSGVTVTIHQAPSGTKSSKPVKRKNRSKKGRSK